MGWLFGWNSKQELIQRLRRDDFYAEGYKARKHSLVGNNHWTLLERPDGSVTISLELISGADRWGYKGLSEDMGPVQLNCPITFLKLVSEPQSDIAKEWRERVQAYHANKKNRIAYSTGQIWQIYGKEYRLTKPVRPRKGWIGIELESNQRFRLPFIHLAKGSLVTPDAATS